MQHDNIFIIWTKKRLIETLKLLASGQALPGTITMGKGKRGDAFGQPIPQLA
jgi:hypothetical protein